MMCTMFGLHGGSKLTTITHFLVMHETAICRDLQNSPNWDPHITRQLVYTHTPSIKILCPQKFACSYILIKT